MTRHTDSPSVLFLLLEPLAAPLGYAGGDTNLYRYVGNQPTGRSDPSGLYEVDFHFYTIYYILLARGWAEPDAREIAGWSQYVDDDFQTSPLWNGANPTRLRRFHFWDCGPDTATLRAPESLRKMITESIGAFGNPPTRAQKIQLGILLHTYADTFAHEGFTSWHNTDQNVRKGGFYPNIGHADASERGEAPDHPYNNVPKALAAAKQIYGFFPRGTGKHVPWHVACEDLRQAFSAPKLRGPSFKPKLTHAEMETAMLKILKLRFGTEYRYDSQDFAKYRGEFLNEAFPDD